MSIVPASLSAQGLPEAALLGHIKYEWLTLVVIIYIVFKKPIEQFFSFVKFKVTKKKTMSLEQYLESDQKEREKRQKEIDLNFDKVQAELNRFGTKLMDVREEMKMLNETLEDYEQKTDTMNRVNLENTLFNDSKEVSPFRKLKAFLYLTAMGANGRIKMRGLKLILAHKEVWLDVLDVTSERLSFGKPEDKEYLDSVLSEINKRIFEINSKPYAQELENLEPVG